MSVISSSPPLYTCQLQMLGLLVLLLFISWEDNHRSHENGEYIHRRQIIGAR